MRDRDGRARSRWLRRSTLLRAGVAVLVVGSLAGCTVPGSDGTGAQCHRTHELVSADGSTVEPAETYAYEELSDDAQRAVDEVRRNGSFATANESFDPPEFRYGDTTAIYEVTASEETVRIRTYGGEGCDVT